MSVMRVILITIAVMILLEGLVLSIFSKSAAKSIKKMFKNQKNVIKIGLIEIILALAILFIIALN